MHDRTGVFRHWLDSGDAMHHDPRFDRDRHALWDVLRSRGITDERVLSALSAVPRESFVPADLWDRATEQPHCRSSPPRPSASR